MVREKPPKREPPTTERSERMPPGEVGRRRTGGQGKDEAFVCSSDWDPQGRGRGLMIASSFLLCSSEA
jgi:hypothetical protein